MSVTQKLNSLARGLVRRCFYLIPVLSIIVWSFCFRLFLDERARQFEREFELNNYTEFVSGDIYSIARKLDAISKTIDLVCVDAYHSNHLFFQLKNSPCKSSYFTSKVSIHNAPLNDIQINILMKASDKSLFYFGCFIALQLSVLGSLVLSVQFDERMKAKVQQRELEVAASYAKIASQLAHDIRSPLAALKVLTRTSETPNSSPDRDILLNQVIGRIQEIAQEALDNSLVSNPRGEKKGKPILVSELLTEVIGEHQLSAPQNVQIIFEVGEKCRSCFIFGDESKLKRAFSNLCSNAVQSIAPEKSGQVRLKIDRRFNKLMVKISDSGVGMSGEVIKKLGVHGGTFGKPGGKGIGFAFAKEVFSSMKGKIGVRSRVGAGSEITVKLPLASL